MNLKKAPWKRKKSSTRHQSIIFRSHVKFWGCNKTWHGTWLWLILTHMDAKNTHWRKKRGNTAARAGVWIATSLGSRLNNQINYTFTFNLHLSLKNCSGWLKWWHLPLKASSTDILGLNILVELHRQNPSDKSSDPSSRIEVSAGDATENKKNGEIARQHPPPVYFRWEGGGKSEFSWLLSKHWHDPPMVSRFWFHASPHLVPSVPSGFQTAKAEDSGCLVYRITDCNVVSMWEVETSPVTCFSKGCKFIFKTLGTPVNGENPVRMAAALFFFPGAIWTILPFLCRSRISTVSHQDLCIHSRECTRKV